MSPDPGTAFPDDPQADRAAPRPPCRVSIPFTLIACENAQAELLMLKRRKPPFVGRWNFIGGKIDEGESPPDSAVREIAEELGQSVRATSLSYRGVAVWPRQQLGGIDFEGMHLFHVRLNKKSNSNRQLGILDEGTTAWLPLHLLRQDGYYAPVPNFDLLLPLILGQVAPKPLTLFHWRSDEWTYRGFHAPLRRDYCAPDRFAPGKACVPVTELAEVEAAALERLLKQSHRSGMGD